MDSKEIKEFFEQQKHYHERVVKDHARLMQDLSSAVHMLANDALQRASMGSESQVFLFSSGTPSATNYIRNSLELNSTGTMPTAEREINIAPYWLKLSGRARYDGVSANGEIRFIVLEHKEDYNSDFKRMVFAPTNIGFVAVSAGSVYLKEHNYDAFVPFTSKFFRLVTVNHTGVLNADGAMDIALTFIGK
jgi:hypothetical protein